jgi:hypothetical protein
MSCGQREIQTGIASLSAANTGSTSLRLKRPRTILILNIFRIREEDNQTQKKEPVPRIWLLYGIEWMGLLYPEVMLVFTYYYF